MAIYLRLLVIGLATVVAVGCSSVGNKVDRGGIPGERLAVVLSDDSAAFSDVARELTAQADVPVDRYRLGSSVAGQADVLRKLQTRYSTVVTIGLESARAARQLTGKRMVFCQVSSHEEAGLLSDHFRGVSAMPSAREQFRIWKAVSPRLRRVGVIVGPRQAALLAEAGRAAREAGLELIPVQVRSDRETLYAFGRLAPRIQGLWLVPDNRVLSNSVLRGLMEQAVRQGKQVLAFSHELLALGALLSMESMPGDIAAQVLIQARNAEAGDTGVRPLTRGDTRINATMLRRFGLTWPRGIEGQIHAS